jgi:heme oxygenase
LPERLRLETRDLHAAAERSGVMGELVRGRLGLAGYRALINNLHAIYVALESALDAHQGSAHVAPVRMPRLYRAAPLASDLQAMGGMAAVGADLADLADVADATTAYVQRLAGLSEPELVAHAYVRYLGDLHGGQVLRQQVGRSLGLGAEGTRFYDFGNDDEVAASRAALREGLAAVPATPAEADLIVAEARWAFLQHQLLFEQLAEPNAA